MAFCATSGKNFDEFKYCEIDLSGFFLNESTTKHLVTTRRKQAMKLEYLKMKLNRRLVAPAIALAMVMSFGAYEFARPTTAKAAVASPASAPLDDSSVSSLLSLDQAMETLAARVTPAIVNVTVTSKTKMDLSDDSDGLPEGIQGFSQ